MFKKFFSIDPKIKIILILKNYEKKTEISLIFAGTKHQILIKFGHNSNGSLDGLHCRLN